MAAPAVLAQNPNARGQAVAAEHRAEVSLPDRFDTTRIPLRDLPDRPVNTPPRGGRDFEPGRPEPIGNAGGSSVDPAARVDPTDTTGDLSPTHCVQLVNLRYSVYTLTR